MPDHWQIPEEFILGCNHLVEQLDKHTEAQRNRLYRQNELGKIRASLIGRLDRCRQARMID